MWTPLMKKTIKVLLLVLVILLIILLLTSCDKEPITPGNYQPGISETTVNNNWQSQYSDGGVLPNWGSGGTQNNELVGTKWVLTKTVTAFATSHPNDTIRFVSNTEYTLNNGATRPYQLSAGVASTNKTLSLYYFQPFGGSHYSGQVGYYFVSDGFITQAEFHNIQNTTQTVMAWFTKI